MAVVAFSVNASSCRRGRRLAAPVTAVSQVSSSRPFRWALSRERPSATSSAELLHHLRGVQPGLRRHQLGSRLHCSASGPLGRRLGRRPGLWHHRRSRRLLPLAKRPDDPHADVSRPRVEVWCAGGGQLGALERRQLSLHFAVIFPGAQQQPILQLALHPAARVSVVLSSTLPRCSSSASHWVRAASRSTATRRLQRTTGQACCCRLDQSSCREITSMSHAGC